MAPKMRIGLVGLGRHMFEVLAPCLRFMPEHELVAVCDTDPARVARFVATYTTATSYSDHAAMLAGEDLDAIILAVGHAQNFPIIRAALLAGVDVFVEKTPCASVAEARELARLQEESGRFVMVGFNRRYMTPYRMAKLLSLEPDFGPVVLFQSQFHAAPTRSEDFFIVNHVIHHLDLARYLLGEIDVAFAQRLKLDDSRLGMVVNFTARCGTIGTIQAASTLHQSFPLERLELVGVGRNLVVEAGTELTYNRPVAQSTDNARLPQLSGDSGSLSWKPNSATYPVHAHHGFEQALMAFFEAIQTREAPQPDIADAVKTLELVDAVMRCLEQSVG